MNILLHTIALEPARWTPQRVSRPLVELLPQIAEAGFRGLEIFEPHLTSETVSQDIRESLVCHGLAPVILSSYLNLNPSVSSDSELLEKLDQIVRRIAFYGFQKLRLFPGPGMDAADAGAVAVFQGRLQGLAGRLPQTQILLETHDDSLAEDPALLVRLVEELALPNLGLLFQPTFFQPRERILEQVRIEKPHIRHIHFQNRMPDRSFVSLRAGIFPWPEILGELGKPMDATLEFVPSGICAAERFDLAASLKQAREEVEYVRGILGRPASSSSI